MAMTKEEWYAKQEILDNLSENGYPSYAKLLDKFDINLTSDPKVVGYTEPSRGRVVLNRGLAIDQVSTIVRHEILHNFLKHMQRMEDKLGKDVWENRSSQMHEASNIAGDYEISNRGYTQKDKEIARSIYLNGQVLQGLVTEDQHPDWVDLSLEEMYDKVMEEKEKAQQDASNQMQGDPKQGGGKSSGKGQPQIGDKGDQQIQEAEDIERQAKAVLDDAGDVVKQAKQSGDSEAEKDAKDAKDKAKEAGDAAKDIKDALKDSKSGKPESDPSKSKSLEKDGVPTEKKPFGDPAKIEARLKDLKRLLDDIEEGSTLLEESETAKKTERKLEADKRAKEYRDSPLNRFRESLNAFFRKETDYGRGKTWRRFSKNYSDSNIIRKGTARNVAGRIPVINVYFDRSASWDDEKIKVGSQAVATLNKYVQRGEAIMKVYYFSDEIFSDKDSSLANQATSAGPDIVEHARDTRADNVIVMTDDDTNSQGNWNISPLTVPGMVWYLAKGGTPSKMMEFLRGRAGTKLFEI